jgi:hypothetical protein
MPPTLKIELQTEPIQKEYEMWTGKKPDIQGIPEFGAKVVVNEQDNSKLGARGEEGMWVGFDLESSDSLIYWLMF